MEVTVSKSERLLQIYSWLVNGNILSKKELAQRFHVTERSVQRDMESLRCFFAEQRLSQTVLYDRAAGGYRIESTGNRLLSNSEILAVCKILLESRSMRKDEMLPILDKLIACSVPEKNKREVNELIANEKYHYIQPQHRQKILPGLWELGEAVRTHRVIEIEYERMKEPRRVHRVVEPVGIMFSEYYFYLTAFLRNVDKKIEFENKNDIFPTIYRIDRIKSFKVTDERFDVLYAKRFEEGEFRKRVQFMYGGRLQRLRFEYIGPSIEAILDRLPTANVERKTEEGWIITAEVFGKGAEMWLKSQQPYVCRMEIL